jgi:lipopolysaccharide transport system permease protein
MNSVNEFVHQKEIVEDSYSYGKLDLLRELWAYRELFYFLALRDVKVRYKQTVLGVLRALIQPLFTMVVFTVVFQDIAKISTNGIPGPIFYLSGLIPWIYFSSTLTSAGLSLVANSGLLTKIYFPRIILPSAASLGGLLDFAIATIMLIGFVVYYRMPISWNFILWPLLLVPLALLALGASAFLAAVNVKYRDIKYAIPFGIQLLLFITPIIYPASVFPERFRWLLVFNPLSGIIEGFRFAFIPNSDIDWNLFWLSLISSAVIFVAGVIYFRRAERVFADVI